jgi:nitrogenase molybdenum-iron protein alpha chain
MGTNYHSDEVEVREHRLGTIKAYFGTGNDLTEKACSGCLQDGKRCFSTTSYCAHVTAMLDIAVIKDVVVVDHGPVGCSSGIINWNVNYQLLSQLSGDPVRRIKVVSTNLLEADTVFGAKEKLKTTVHTAFHRHHPAAIFVLSTCVSSIIGEDIDGVARELQTELGIPVGFVGCAGLRSKVWASGFDASKHAIINTLIKPPKKKRNLVNFIDFFAQTTPTVVKYLAALDLEPRYFCAFSKVEDYAHMSEAVATTGVCKTLTPYIAAYLEQAYGVPYVGDHFGIGGEEEFKKWFLDIAHIVGKEKEGLAFFNNDREQYIDTISELKRRLKGIRVAITLGPGFAFEIANLMKELGLEVVHTNAHHFDPNVDGAGHTTYPENVSTSISDMQHYETYKILRRLKPDLFIARVHSGQNFAIPLGIPCVSLTGFESFGFDGIVTTGNLILTSLENTNFLKKISKRLDTGFSEEFLDSDEITFVVKEAV